MIPRKHHLPLPSPVFHSSAKPESKTPLWMIVGVVLVVLMGLTYAVPGVSHAVNEIDWAAIIGPLSSGASELLGAVNNASASAAGKTTGVNADAIDGLDSTALLSGGSGGAQYNEDSVHASGSLGDFPLAVQTASPGALGQTGDYVPFQTDSTGRLRVNADPVTVNVPQDGEFYYQQCGYVEAGYSSQLPNPTNPLLTYSSPTQCNDGGSVHLPAVCNIGDIDMGVNCYPTDIEIWDGDVFFVITGMCQRTCRHP